MNHEPETPLPWDINPTPYVTINGAPNHVDTNYAKHAANSYPILVEALKAERQYGYMAEETNARINAALKQCGELE